MSKSNCCNFIGSIPKDFRAANLQVTGSVKTCTARVDELITLSSAATASTMEAAKESRGIAQVHQRDLDAPYLLTFAHTAGNASIFPFKFFQSGTSFPDEFLPESMIFHLPVPLKTLRCMFEFLRTFGFIGTFSAFAADPTTGIAFPGTFTTATAPLPSQNITGAVLTHVLDTELPAETPFILRLEQTGTGGGFNRWTFSVFVE